MAGFDDFLGRLLDDLRALAEAELHEHAAAAFRDGRAFVDALRDDLDRWTGLLAAGDLTPEDFAWLVEGKRDLAEMEALRQAGLARARLDRFRSALLETVVGSALRFFV